MIIKEEGVDPDKKEANVLVIDGGATYTIFPLAVMQMVEKLTGQSVADYFDMITGVSGGAIVGAGLLTPGDDGKPKYTTDYFASNMAPIFASFLKKSFFQKLLPGAGLFRPVYESSAKEKELEEMFGNLTFNDLNKDLLVGATDILSARAFYTSKYIGSFGRKALYTSSSGLFDSANIAPSSILRASTAVTDTFNALSLFPH